METPGLQTNNSGLNQISKGDGALIKTLVPFLDGLILLTGLIGQTLVMIILTGRRKKESQPSHGTDTLLLALCAADLLLLLCQPFHTYAITLGFWPFGGFLCRAISFLGVACSTASVFTLAALAATRYLAVVHPTWTYRARMNRRVKVIVALLWIPASALAAPQFAFRTITFSNTVYCFAFLSDFSRLVYSIALFVFGFALPLSIIVVMYSKIYCFLRHARQTGNAPQLERYQQQVTHTSALLVLIFTLLWLPSYILMFSIIRGTLASSPGFNTFALLARLLSSSVAVVNPLLYGFMSQKFRRDLVEMGRESWTRCRSCLICCPRLMSRHTVRPFEHQTSSDTPQN
ncbi:galanin receptor type 1 [Poecilia latipinna]|uniref:galanin receptor type 1 n=1 Tax=Poecilia latipinna TaxID=48699 RepID=UPI00072DC79E|nr:PREDICTED: galanin receptor type 1-like [Poecilia latipinna]